MPDARAKREPAEVFPPGEFIAEEATERGWSAEFVAKRLALSTEEYADLLTGKLRLNVRLAELAGALFGTGPVLWANLEMAWSRRKLLDSGSDLR